MNTFRKLVFLPDPLATWSDAVDGLHASLLITAVVACVVLFAYTTYALIFFRRRAPFGPTPRIQSSTPSKILSTGGIFTLFLAWWVLGFHTFVRMQSPPAGALDIQVVAKQWTWTFVYDDGTSSAGLLVVPVRTPIRLVMMSRDVIHSLFFPALRVKRDVVPGQTTTMWFTATHTGTFRAACAEFCGLDHSRMVATLVVLDEDDWQEWAAGDRSSPLADRGRTLAARKGCLRCHTVDGAADVGPTWVGLYRSVVTLQDGSSLVADETYLTRSMMDPAADVVVGFSPVMPTYRGLLSPDEVGALLAYIRALGSGPDVEAP